MLKTRELTLSNLGIDGQILGRAHRTIPDSNPVFYPGVTGRTYSVIVPASKSGR